jgi:hypothetical protein
MTVSLTATAQFTWLNCQIAPGESSSAARLTLGAPTWIAPLGADSVVWGYEADPLRPSFQIRLYRDRVRAITWVYFVD